MQKISCGESINDYEQIDNSWLKKFHKGTVQSVAGEIPCYDQSCTPPKGLDFCADSNVKFTILEANYGGTKNEQSMY